MGAGGTGEGLEGKGGRYSLASYLSPNLSLTLEVPLQNPTDLSLKTILGRGSGKPLGVFMGFEILNPHSFLLL